MDITELQNVQQSDVSSLTFPAVRLAQSIEKSATSFVTNTPLVDEDGSEVTKACILGIRKTSGYVEKYYAPPGAVSGVNVTGVTPGIEQGGLDFTTGSADRSIKHDDGEEVFIVVSGQILQQQLDCLLGNIKTGATNFHIGDGTNDATQGFTIDQGISSSVLKYGADASGNPLITLPGGSSFIPGAGAGAISGGDGIDVTASVISVDTTDTNTFVQTTAGAGDSGKVAILDASGLIEQANIEEWKDVTASAVEINQALFGIGANVTALNLDTLNDGGDADGRHGYDSKQDIDLTVFVPAGEFLVNNADAILGAQVFANIKLTDGNSRIISGSVEIPQTASSISSIEILYEGASAGNLELAFASSTVSMASGSTITADTLGATTYAGTNSSDLEHITVPSSAYNGLSIVAGNILSLRTTRTGASGSDTYNTDWEVYGYRITFA